MKLRGWPFLVSRTKTVDHRTIVAPLRLLNKAKGLATATVFSNAADDQENIFRKRRVFGLSDRPCVIFYRRLTAMSSFWGTIASEQVDTPSKDADGRELWWVEGFITWDESASDIWLDGSAFTAVRTALSRLPLADYWKNDREDVLASDDLPLEVSPCLTRESFLDEADYNKPRSITPNPTKASRDLPPNPSTQENRGGTFQTRAPFLRRGKVFITGLLLGFLLGILTGVLLARAFLPHTRTLIRSSRSGRETVVPGHRMTPP